MHASTSREGLKPTYVNFALSASIAAERIGELKKAIAAVPDTRIIYFRVAAGRLRIVEEEWPVESDPDGSHAIR